MLSGLMMDGFQLSLATVVQRAERLTPSAPVVSRRGDGSIRRTTIGAPAVYPVQRGPSRYRGTVAEGHRARSR